MQRQPLIRGKDRHDATQANEISNDVPTKKKPCKSDRKLQMGRITSTFVTLIVASSMLLIACNNFFIMSPTRIENNDRQSQRRLVSKDSGAPRSNKTVVFQPTNDVLENSCDRLYSFRHIVNTDNRKCIQHNSLHWKACEVSPLQVDISRIDGPVGNETIESVKGRTEQKELLFYHLGAFQMETKVPHGMDSTWSRIIESTRYQALTLKEDSVPTVFLQRPTYANPCFWTAALYNVYVTLHQFELLNESALRIVWMDGHAWNPLDSVWKHLFRATEVLHIKQLDPRMRYNRPYFVHTESTFHDPGLRKHHNQDACKPDSSLHQFRDFVLERHGLSLKQTDTKQLTLLQRSDHSAHPRSDGVTDRKIHDIDKAQELLAEQYPGYTITTVSFEDMPYREQLAVISQTDVLVTVHGAGNVHVIFLPSHATLVEYYPPGFSGRVRFKYLAECMGLRHVQKHARIASKLPEQKITVHLT